VTDRDLDRREPGLARVGVGFLLAYALAFAVVAWWLS